MIRIQLKSRNPQHLGLRENKASFSLGLSGGIACPIPDIRDDTFKKYFNPQPPRSRNRTKHRQVYSENGQVQTTEGAERRELRKGESGSMLRCVLEALFFKDPAVDTETERVAILSSERMHS
jgi:hypothetical protein